MQQIGASFNRAKKKFAIGEDTMYALKDSQSNITYNLDEAVKAAELFHMRMYARNLRSGENTWSTSFACVFP